MKEMSILINLHNVITIDNLHKKLKIKVLKDLEHLMYNRSIDSSQFSFISQLIQILIKLSISSVKCKFSFIENITLRKCNSSSQKSNLQQEFCANNIDFNISVQSFTCKEFLLLQNLLYCNCILTYLTISLAE